MQTSFGYVLNQRPFRDSSVILDLFTEEHGRICCIARPAKKRGKVLKGSLQPFRYLMLQWIGKGDVQTLTESDERGRHSIPASEMMLGLYLNELLLLLTKQHVPFPELFSAYKYTLHKLHDPLINQQIMMRFELYLLSCLGYPIELQNEALDEVQVSDNLDGEISQEIRYRFTQEEGLKQVSISTNIYTHDSIISMGLLVALQDMKTMNENQWKQLRLFIDNVFKQLAPRTIHSRQLLHL